MINAPSNNATTTVGVFDSGFGGLTVLRALLHLIPSARYLYLGDTARLPYGSKSRATISRYAVSSARFLLDQGADLLVIACNTATALALDDIRAAASPIPVIGVVEPGAQAALTSTGTSSTSRPGPTVLVLATAATVQSHAYLEALRHLGLAAIEKACPLLVPLVEEGWIDHPVTRDVARIYLSEALAQHPNLSTLLLGCTHYPLLTRVFEQTLAGLRHPLSIIDSAQATAHTVAAHLQPQNSQAIHPPISNLQHALAGADLPGRPPLCTFYATDSVAKFARLGSQFLGQPLPEVHLIDLGG